MSSDRNRYSVHKRCTPSFRNILWYQCAQPHRQRYSWWLIRDTICTRDQLHPLSPLQCSAIVMTDVNAVPHPRSNTKPHLTTVHQCALLWPISHDCCVPAVFTLSVCISRILNKYILQRVRSYSLLSRLIFTIYTASVWLRTRRCPEGTIIGKQEEPSPGTHNSIRNTRPKLVTDVCMNIIKSG